MDGTKAGSSGPKFFTSKGFQIVADILNKGIPLSRSNDMLIYKILACVMLICFAVVAYLYLIFQMPVHGFEEKATRDKTGADNSILIKTINDG